MALHSIFCSRVVFVILSQQSREDPDCDTQPQLATDGITMTSMLDTYAMRDEFMLHRRLESRYQANSP